MTLPTSLGGGDAGHLSDHDTLHTVYNASLNEDHIRYASVNGSNANDGLTWRTAKRDIWNGTDGCFDERPGGTQSIVVYAGAGVFSASVALVMREGDRIRGNNMGPLVGQAGTKLEVADGFPSSTHFITVGDGTNFAHWASLEDLYIECHPGATDNLSDGFAAVRIDGSGEGTELRRVHIASPPIGVFYDGGTRIGAPCTLYQVSVGGPKETAFKLGKCNAGILYSPSGDGDHPTGTASFIEFINQESSSWTVINPKIEMDFEPCFDIFYGLNADIGITPSLNVIGGFWGPTTDRADIFKFSLGGGDTDQVPQLNVFGFFAFNPGGGAINWINDTQASYTYAQQSSGHDQHNSGILTYASRVLHLSPLNEPAYFDGAISIKDGIASPGTISGQAHLFVSSNDGDLKIKYGDGTVKTIVVDT